MDQEEEEETRRLACRMCGHIGLEESDGFYYCQDCGAQADDIILTGVADEDFVDKDGEGAALYSARHTRRSKLPPRSSLPDPSSQAWLRFTQQHEQQGSADNNQLPQHYNIKREIHHDDYYCWDGVGPTEPGDFGAGAVGKLTYEDYYNEVRIRYVMGMQWVIQMQCEALVEKFRVNPLICGVAGTVWLRFVAGTGVFKEGWADDSLMESEILTPGELEGQRPRAKYANEPHNAHGQRAVMVWFRHLRKMIPLSCSLAISFLACHVAREAVLPTDIGKWSLEGKLPYFTAHIEIEKRFEGPSSACPISSSLMFRPSQVVPVQKLESMAAYIAESVGLHLPPVNFYEIAKQYLKQLYLPVEKILPHACRIYEWSMPPDLWLSKNESRYPTRTCVMSILIVAIRILYNINGFGAWESSLSRTNEASSSSHHNDPMNADAENGSGSPLVNMDDLGDKPVPNSCHFQKSEFDSVELLHNLETRYKDMVNTYEFAKDLPSYLQYCKDVVFSGTGPSHKDHREEEELIEKLWDFYQNDKDCEPMHEDPGVQSNSHGYQKKPRDDNRYAKNFLEEKKIREESHEGSFTNTNSCQQEDSPQCNPGNDHSSLDSLEYQDPLQNDEASEDSDSKDKDLRRLKLDMEENRFCYIPPRVNIKRLDYLHYVRKKDEGTFTYVAHLDYYILLRACARVAQVDIRIMHCAVLSFERRLAWLEKRIDHCLHLTPPSITCEFCGNLPDESEDDPVGFSNLNLQM